MAAVPTSLLPSEEDLLYEEEILRNPFSLKLWLRYLAARVGSPPRRRYVLYERAVAALPGSYKLWHAYLKERRLAVRGLPPGHSAHVALNNAFERALVTMHRMPRIWLEYLSALVADQKLITKARRTFDRALRSLPAAQHDRIWTPYIRFARLPDVPVETGRRILRRYLKFDPSQAEEYVDFLIAVGHWREAAERLAGSLNDPSFVSTRGRTRHAMWLQLCDIITRHADAMVDGGGGAGEAESALSSAVGGALAGAAGDSSTGATAGPGLRLNVDAIVRAGIARFSQEVGRLWAALAEHYVRLGLLERARDVYEDALQSVTTVRDFSVVFDALAAFEESVVAAKMEMMGEEEEEEEEEEEVEEEEEEEDEEEEVEEEEQEEVEEEQGQRGDKVGEKGIKEGEGTNAADAEGAVSEEGGSSKEGEGEQQGEDKAVKGGGTLEQGATTSQAGFGGREAGGKEENGEQNEITMANGSVDDSHPPQAGEDEQGGGKDKQQQQQQPGGAQQKAAARAERVMRERKRAARAVRQALKFLRRAAAAAAQKSGKASDWSFKDNDVELRLARLEALMERRPELLSAVLLRQNPHNVHEWHKRAKLFEANPEKQVLTYTEAVRTVSPSLAVGRPHTLWLAFARLYEKHGDLRNARAVLERAVVAPVRSVEDLAAIWCEWAEMELRHHNFAGARELLKRATIVPSAALQRQAALEGDDRPQLRVHRSLKVWALFVDVEESLGSLDSTRQLYDRIIDLKIATPQIIINYALLLEEHKYFEESFKVFERGVAIFKYPHVREIWSTYIHKFVQRYGGKKLERARDLFEQALENAPATDCRPLYLAYAKLEEEYGLARHAMAVYERAAKAVPDEQKMGVYELYIARAAELFGVAKTREIYERAIESGLPDRAVKTMCLKYAALERRLGEIDRARAIFVHASQLADPREAGDFWEAWNAFEIAHGNEDTFREMMRIKRSVSASYSQSHFILPEYLMQKAAQPALPPSATGGGSAPSVDHMLALEQAATAAAQQASGGAIPPAGGAAGGRVPLFVSAGSQQAPEGKAGIEKNPEEIELAEGEEEEEEEEEDEGVEGEEGRQASKVSVAQKAVPAGVFGSLADKAEEMAKREREEGGDRGGEEPLGALERIKRQRRP